MSFPSCATITLALLFFTVYSNPVEEQASPGVGFTIHQKPNPRFVANGTQHLKAAYAKYQDYSRYTTNGSDEVVATPAIADSEYFAPITINGQELDVNFDSGSADFWVFSTSLPEDDQVGHVCFDPTKTVNSTFSTLAGYKWKITYGDDSTASGTVGIGEVDIGGAMVTKQAVQLATSMSSSLASDTYINGIVGFAWSDINTVTPKPQKTWFDNVKASLPLPIFTADLRHNAPGSYDFGFIDETKFVGGTIFYQQVVTRYGYWMFEFDGYKVGDGELSTSKDLDPAIVDTGTTLLMMEEDLVEAYYVQVPGAEYDDNEEGFVFPCSSKLPDLILQFGNYSAVIGSQYLIYSQVSATYCFGALQEGPDGLNVIGDIFFKAQFVVFDGGSNPRVGFAPKS